MKFLIDKESLLKTLNIVGRVIPGSPAVPVLNGVHIEAAEGRLIVTGGDSDIRIVKELELPSGNTEGEITETGTLVVPIKLFHELVKKMPGKPLIKIEKDGHRIKITSGEIVTVLSGIDAEDYPALPEIPSEHSVAIKGSLLLEMIKETQFAAAKSDTRAVLTGVNWMFSEGQMTMAATNSQRLAMRKAALESSLEGSYILPVKALAEIGHSINVHDLIKIFPGENAFIFKSEDVLIYSRLISGTYPDITRIIPEESSTELVISKSLLLQAIDRANLLASLWKNNNVTLSIIENNKIEITSSTSEVGQICERLIPAEIRGEKDLKVSFDGKYLAEALKSLKDDMVTLSFGGSLRPILIRPYNKKSSLHLISPVRA